MSKELPADVIVDILSRVPTRYILRFKSVSKSWYALFQNPNFITKHVQNQSTISDPSFLFPPEKSSTATSTSDHTLGLVLSDSFYKLIKIRIQIDVSKPLEVCGSCNGLICLSVLRWASIILLWNPATRIFKDLPISPIDRPHPQVDPPLQVVLGFWFDDVVKDYKVLRIVEYGIMSKQVEIYSLSTNSWREIKFKTLVGFIFLESACRVFLNGKFYWDGIGVVDNDNKKLIVCFDLHEEAFSYIIPPDFRVIERIEEYIEVRWQVVAMKESLSVITSRRIGIGMFDLWVMKEYGVWTKYTSFELQTIARPLGCGLRGEILLETNDNIVVYASDSRRVTNLENYRVDFLSKVFNHVGSLVPINGGKVATRTNLSSVVPDPSLFGK